MTQYVDKKTVELSLLVSFACLLQIAESMIPFPIPGIRLGFANAVTLIAIVSFGVSSGIMVSVLRAIISSLFLGTFLSPAFFLSFSGALTSSLIMGGTYFLFTRKTKIFSIYGISTLGAVTHTLTQVGLAYLLVVRHKSVFVLLPFLLLTSLATGLITAYIADKLGKKLALSKQMDKNIIKLSFKEIPEVASSSLLSKIPPLTKIITTLFVAAFIIFAESLVVLGVTFCFILALSLIFKVNLVKKLRAIILFLLFSVLLPFAMFFLLGAAAYSMKAFLVIIFRVLSLFLISYIMNACTSAYEMNKGISKLLSPLKMLGVKIDRLERVVTLTLQFIPVLFSEAKLVFAKYKPAGKNIFKLKIKAFLGNIINDAALVYRNMISSGGAA